MIILMLNKAKFQRLLVYMTKCVIDKYPLVSYSLNMDHQTFYIDILSLTTPTHTFDWQGYNTLYVYM